MTATPALPERIGRYRILEPIGRGSMGRVYRAHDPHTDRDVALKVVTETPGLPPAAAEDLRERFLLEARAAGRLSHPGIVLVYDADVDPDTGDPYLVMELVAGTSLAQALRERGPLPWREAAAIGAQVAAALAHAHERGIVHRDVKPGNVLVGADGRVKVSDFGIAKLVGESHTVTGSVMGTPSYMSPEQIRSQPLDGRSDLFGVGALLYEMVTGEAPFRGDSLAAITHKVVSVDPRPPSFARPGLPEEAERIVLRALAKERDQRFQTGTELAATLTAAIGAEEQPTLRLRPPESVAAEPPEPERPVPRTVSARERAWLGVAAAALVFLGLVAVGYWAGHRGEASPESPAVATGGAGQGNADVQPPAPRGAPPRSAPVEREPADEASPSARPGQEATLQVQFNNRLRHGRLTLRVDGREVWAAALNVPKDPRSLIAGATVRKSIPVPPGTHEIEVRIVQSSARIDSRGTIRGDFGPGQRRWLRVVLIPYLPELQLDWES